MDIYFKSTGLQYPAVRGFFCFLLSIVRITADGKSVLPDSVSRLSLVDQGTSYAINIRGVIPGGTLAKVHSYFSSPIRHMT